MSEADAGLVSIVIVAADSGPLLARCVAAALASSAQIEVILVDNASGDGQPACVAEAHAADPRLRSIVNARNIGFGPACNQGAAVARGDALLFLNPDCLLEPDTVAALRSIALADATLGMLGVDVRDMAGASARANRRREPTLRRSLMSLSGLDRFAPDGAGFDGVEMPASPARSVAAESVDAVSGACMYLPRAVFERVGGFDEGYFLHVEDLDLCRRVRDLGLRVAIVPSLRVVHVQGSSSRSRPLFVLRHKHRGMWRYFTKFDPAARNPLLRVAVWLGIWAHFLLVAPRHLWRRRASEDSAATS